MKAENKLLSFFKKIFSCLNQLLVILIPVLLAVNVGYFYLVAHEKEAIVNHSQYTASENSAVVDFVIRTAINDTYNDIKVIKNSDELTSYVNDSTSINLDEAKQLFYRIASNKSEFLTIKYLDLLGNEVIRVDNVNGNIVIVPDNQLITRSDTYYFGEAFSLDENQLYVSYLDLETDSGVIITPYQPLLRFAISVYDDSNQKTGFIFINYNADKILSVFDEYVDSIERNIHLGIYSNNRIFLFNKSDESETYELEIIDDVSEDSELLNSDSVSLRSIHIDSKILELMVGSEDFLKIYAHIDYDAFIDNQLNFVFKSPLYLIIVDVLTLIFFVYVGYVIKKRKEEKSFLDATKYLSDINNDAIVITDSNNSIVYVNDRFMSIFGYKEEDIIGKDKNEVLRLDSVGRKEDKYRPNRMVWNRNIYGTYILTSYNEELIEGKYENKTINIYSNPPINSDRLFETIPGINNRYSTAIETISEIFKYREIKKNQSSMILIQLSNSQLGENYSTTNIYSLNKCGLCEYLRANLTQDYIISIPLKNHILISFNKKAEEDGLSSYLDIVSKLIDEFKYRLVFTRNLNYLITTDIAEDDDYTYQKMIFNVFAAMHYLVRSRNLRSIQYSKKMKQKVIKDKLIRDQLENAFTNDEFYMNYQILKSVDGNRTTGVEALLRWNNPILGNVPPMEFIPIIEDSYFINQLSVMVVTKVVNDLTNCYELFPKDFRVSINLTNYDFHNEFIIKKLINIILESKIPTYHFCFEITESGYLENTIKTKDIIDYLHSINIQIAIDDFGTGFSSLSSLKNVNADKVKIDRTFIKDYPQADNGLMHKTIAFLIKSLGYKIVIEGIETKAQLELAKATDCDEYQGFIITKPKDYVDFYEDLKKEFEEKTTK